MGTGKQDSSIDQLKIVLWASPTIQQCILFIDNVSRFAIAKMIRRDEDKTIFGYSEQLIA